jgi:hypothetical protein
MDNFYKRMSILFFIVILIILGYSNLLQDYLQIIFVFLLGVFLNHILLKAYPDNK